MYNERGGHTKKVAHRFQILSIALALALAGINVFWSQNSKSSMKGIDPTLVANYIHPVIEADRTLYATHVGPIEYFLFIGHRCFRTATDISEGLRL